MGILLDKSNNNLQASEILIKNNLHSSSVHCAYYSSVQMMIHLLLNKFGFTQDKLEEEAKKENKGSHIFAKNYLHQKMKDKGIRFDATIFYRTVGELKNKREKADYQEENIEIDFSQEAVKQANEVNKILKKVFEI